MDGDPRFARLARDPRFRRFPSRAAAAVQIDERFAKALDDGDADAQPAARDEGEDEPAARAEEESSSDEEGAEAAAAAARPGRGLRGSVSLSSSSDDEDEDGPGGAGEAEEEGVLATFGADAEPGADAGADPTPRLAVVDLEWDRLRAVDVFAVLRSFLPPGGALRRVAVHPSDLGLSRLRDEEQHGPRAAFATEKQPGEGVAAEALRAYERERLRYYYAVAEFDSAATACAVYCACDGVEFERSSTRLDLRYVPDSLSLAGRPVRDEATCVPPGYSCVEYTSRALQQTAVVLSWDADDPGRSRALTRTLTADQLKDEDFAAYLGSGSEGEPDGGEPPGGGGGASPQGAAAAADADAPPGGGAAALRARLLGGLGDGAAPFGRARKAAPGEADMVVSFGVGLSGRMQARRDAAAAQLLQQQQPAEGVWDAHLRERRAKRAAAKRAAAAPAEAAAAAADDGFDDPFFAQPAAGDAAAWPGEGGGDGGDGGGDAAGGGGGAAGGSAGRPARKLRRRAAPGAAAADPAAAADSSRRAAELQLLLMDDAALRAGGAAVARDAPNHPPAGGAAASTQRLSRKQARAAAKAAKQQRGAPGGALDVSDPRFAALFTRPDFALDPTNPRFKAAQRAAAAVREAASAREAET